MSWLVQSSYPLSGKTMEISRCEWNQIVLNVWTNLYSNIKLFSYTKEWKKQKCKRYFLDLTKTTFILYIYIPSQLIYRHFRFQEWQEISQFSSEKLASGCFHQGRGAEVTARLLVHTSLCLYYYLHYWIFLDNLKMSSTFIKIYTKILLNLSTKFI